MLALGFALLLLAAAAYMAFSIRRFHLAPIFWCASWGLMLLLYRLLGYNYEYERWVIAFTIGCVLAWLAGHLLVAGVEGRRNEAGRPARAYQVRRLRWFMYGCTIVGLIAPVNWMAANGIGISRLTSVGAVTSVAQDTYELFLQQKVEQDAINKLTLMVALAGLIVAGIYIGIGRPIEKIAAPQPAADGEQEKPPRPVPYWLLLAPLLPYLLMLVLTTIRTLVIVPLLMLFGSWVAGLYLVGRERSLFRPDRMALIGAGLVAAIIVFVYMQSIRAGDPGLQHIGKTVGSLRLWVAGYEPGLVAWLTRVWDHHMRWGASTFRVIAGVFGSDDAKLVYGTGAVDIGMYETSNAMTALRFFVEDWGIAGAVIFSLVFGMICGAASEQVRRGRLLVAPIYALLLATVIFAPNSWFLNYGTRAIAPLLTIVYLALFGSRIVERTHAPGARRVRKVRRSSADAKPHAEQPRLTPDRP